MVNYDLIKDKRWMEFIQGIRYGEVAQFSATTDEVASIRTTAARINASNIRDFEYSVEANGEGRVQIFTKPRLS